MGEWGDAFKYAWGEIVDPSEGSDDFRSKTQTDPFLPPLKNSIVMKGEAAANSYHGIWGDVLKTNADNSSLAFYTGTSC